MQGDNASVDVQTEYPIREATLKEVGYFYRKADDEHPIRFNWWDVIPACDGFAVALYQDKIVGAVATSSKPIHDGPLPTLAALFVLPDFERRGIGSRLFLYGMNRLLAGVPRVYCEATDWEMVGVIKKNAAEIKERLKYTDPNHASFDI